MLYLTTMTLHIKKQYKYDHNIGEDVMCFHKRNANICMDVDNADINVDINKCHYRAKNNITFTMGITLISS